MSRCRSTNLLLLVLLCEILLVVSHETQTQEAGLKPPANNGGIAEIKLQLREEVLNLREEMYSIMGESRDSLVWVVQELVREVREYKSLVAEQGKTVENLIEEHTGVVEELIEEHTGVVEELKSDLKTSLDELENLKMRMDVVRSEVRLISQHKLTWQNSTSSNKHHSDFLVDGVYRLAHDEGGMNPISHTADTKAGPNMVVSIDLGALFKIHTVKLWKRTHTCCDNRFVGLLIYADDRLIGVTSDVQYLYNIRVQGDVYATKILIKQPLALTLNFLEIQVFGNGPYSENEV